MKHLYTLLLALLCVGAMSARTLTFYQGNKAITPGSTVYFSDVTIEDVGGGYRSVVMDPKLYLGTDIYSSKIKITARCTSGQEVSMCAGGDCVFATSITKENITVQTGQKLDLMFEYADYNLAPGAEIPTVTVEFEAVDVQHTETLTTFTIVMGPNASALSEIRADKEIVYTPAGLEYNLQAPSTIALYSITGTQVLSVKADGQGTVNTHSLRPGIYLYAVTSRNGRTTGKISVR